MKKLLHLTICTLVIAFGMSTEAKAQVPAVPHYIYGASPFQDSLWAIDTTNWSVVQRTGPTLVGFTITGINGIAYDPTTYETYVIMKLSAVSGRVLGKIDLATGICTQVGNLGDNFSSIMFDETGQLWGATGDGATVPETMYKIDKTTGAVTLQYAMGNGADGEVISYNRADNHIYHWSGNGTVVMEKWPLSNNTYTPVNIPTSGTPGGETFGMLYLDATHLIVSNISSSFLRLNPNGTYGASIMNLPDDLRGLVLPPAFAISNDTICEETETIFIGAGNLQEFDSVIYNWGDSNTDVMAANTNGASHVYSAPGTYTITIELNNGTVQDTVMTYTLVVNNIPNVSLSGITNLCPNDTITLTGSSGGSSQWYMNGAAIVGATTNTLQVSAPGVYNMYKTNLNGCGDSASTGLTVVSVLNPVVNLGPDTVLCSGTQLDAMNAGATYFWNDSTTAQMLAVTAAGTYSVMVTDTNGCSAADTVTITGVNAVPVVTLGNDTSICGTLVLDAGNPGLQYLWNSGSTLQTDTAAVTGMYYVTVTDSNSCSGMDTINVTVTTSLNVTLGGNQSNCTGNAIVLDAGAFPNSSYTWSNAAVTQTISAAASGTYYVTVMDSVSGCMGSDTATLAINTAPVVSLGGTFFSCAAAYVFDAGNPGDVYLWNDSTTAQTLTVTGNGTYYVTVTDTISGCVSSDTATITFTIAPVVTFSMQPDTLCNTDLPFAISGSPAGGVFSGFGVVNNNQFSPGIGGPGINYVTYTYTDQNSCSVSVTDSLFVVQCIGINEVNNGAAFNLFPNPSDGLFTIELAQPASLIQVVDMLGNIVYTARELNSGKNQVDLNSQSAGVYFIKVTAGDVTSVSRLVIRK